MPIAPHKEAPRPRGVLLEAPSNVYGEGIVPVHEHERDPVTNKAGAYIRTRFLKFVIQDAHNGQPVIDFQDRYRLDLRPVLDELLKRCIDKNCKDFEIRAVHNIAFVPAGNLMAAVATAVPDYESRWLENHALPEAHTPPRAQEQRIGTASVDILDPKTGLVVDANRRAFVSLRTMFPPRDERGFLPIENLPTSFDGEPIDPNTYQIVIRTHGATDFEAQVVLDLDFEHLDTLLKCMTDPERKHVWRGENAICTMSSLEIYNGLRRIAPKLLADSEARQDAGLIWVLGVSPTAKRHIDAKAREVDNKIDANAP